MAIYYSSTRGGEKNVTASQAILKGLAEDGGLFMPDTIPVLGWIDDVAVLGLAFKVANRYIKTRHQEEAKKYFPFGGSN